MSFLEIGETFNATMVVTYFDANEGLYSVQIKGAPTDVPDIDLSKEEIEKVDPDLEERILLKRIEEDTERLYKIQGKKDGQTDEVRENNS